MVIYQPLPPIEFIFHNSYATLAYSVFRIIYLLFLYRLLLPAPITGVNSQIRVSNIFIFSIFTVIYVQLLLLYDLVC
jgi:hypothetical protein